METNYMNDVGWLSYLIPSLSFLALGEHNNDTPLSAFLCSLQIFVQNTGRRALFTNNQWERAERRRTITPTPQLT